MSQTPPINGTTSIGAVFCHPLFYALRYDWVRLLTGSFSSPVGSTPFTGLRSVRKKRKRCCSERPVKKEGMGCGFKMYRCPLNKSLIAFWHNIQMAQTHLIVPEYQTHHGEPKRFYFQPRPRLPSEAISLLISDLNSIKYKGGAKTCRQSGLCGMSLTLSLFKTWAAIKITGSRTWGRVVQYKQLRNAAYL